MEFRFVQLKSNYSLFTKKHQTAAGVKNFVAVLVYVDDIILASSLAEVSQMVK